MTTKYLASEYGMSSTNSPRVNSQALTKLFSLITNSGGGMIVLDNMTFTIQQTIIQNANNVTLKFRTNTVLQAPESTSDFNWDRSKQSGLLSFVNCSNMLIKGEPGCTINGNGQIWWNKVDNRPQLITIVGCNQFEITRVVLLNSPFYNLRIFDSNDLNLHDFEISAPEDSPNTDGINIDSGVSNLTATNVTIRNGDDAFAVNAFQKPTSDIIFQNSTISAGHGISIGSGVYESISSVTFENLNISNTKYGCRIKCKEPPSNYSQKSGSANDIEFDNITFNNIQYNPIYLTTSFGGDSSDYVQLSNIKFSNILSTGSKYNLRSEITGDQLKTPLILDNVVFKNVNNSDPSNDMNLIENTDFELIQPVTGVNTENS